MPPSDADFCIAIVGRSNVGKSTLFNRLSRSRKAIVGNREGITVDWQELLIKPFAGKKSLRLIDTGGVGKELEGNPLKASIEKAAEDAIAQARLILFVVDGSHAINAEDENVAAWLRKRLPGQCPVWLIANKSDKNSFDLSSYYSLGFDAFLGVSCEHNRGFELFWESLDELVPDAALNDELDDEDKSAEEKSDKILVMGRPNMGKSTLINALTNKERHAVSDVAGTTRDLISSELEVEGLRLELVDTAGLRRPGRRDRQVEWVAGDKLKKESRKAQMALVLIDASEGVTDQDAAICGFALDAGLSLILLINKWDLVKDSEEKDDLLWNLKRSDELRLDFMKTVPRLKVSAKTGKGVSGILPVAQRLLEARKQRVPTAMLNRVFEEKIENREHPGVDGCRRVKFYYLSQVGSNPPEFVMFTNVEANRIHFSFRRYVVNVLRSEFNFEACPIKVHFKKR